jgi:sensor domain CHASE-containing protein
MIGVVERFFMEPGKTNAGWPKLVILAAGGCCTLLGLAVLFGLYTSSWALTYVTSSLSPMQPTTALSVWLCGVGFLAMVNGWRYLAAVSGVIVAAIALLTFIQYLFVVDWGFDQFLLAIAITNQPVHPGRMSPPTALCFTLSGVSLALMSRPAPHRYRPLLLGACASVVTALALAILVRHATDTVHLHWWGQYLQMAVHMALGFIGVSTGIFAFAWHDDRVDTCGTPTWLPILVGMGALTMTFCAWEALEVQEHAHIRQMVQSESASSRSVRSELTASLDAQIHTLERMARRWENAGRLAVEDWEFEALLNMQDFRGYQGIGWVDPTFEIRWLVPMEGNRRLLDSPLPPQERLQLELAPMGSRQSIISSHLIDLSQGARGLMVYIPMFSGEDFGGFLMGIFSVQRLLEAILAERIGSGYSIAVFDENGEIYDRSDQSEPFDLAWGHETVISLYGHVWRVRVWPTPETLAMLSSPLDEAVLVTGIVVAVFLAWLVRVAQVARRRLYETIAINRALAREIIERQRAETALHEAEQMYRQILDGITDMVFCKDRQSRFVWANQAFLDYYSKSREQVRDIIGSPCPIPEYTRQHIRDDGHVFNTGTVLHIPEEPLWRSDEDARLFHTVKAPIFNADGTVAMLVGVSRHLSERQPAELELAQARDAGLQSIRLTSKFLAHMSQEIRSSLNGIISMTDLLMETAQTVEQREYTEAVRSSADALLSIVNDLLAFSKTEAAKLTTGTIDFDLRAAPKRPNV